MSQWKWRMTSLQGRGSCTDAGACAAVQFCGNNFCLRAFWQSLAPGKGNNAAQLPDLKQHEA